MEPTDLISVETLLKNLKSAKHDLNNLHNNVLNATELLKDNYSENSDIGKLTCQIQKNTILASKIISQLTPRENISDHSLTKLNLNILIEDTIKLVDSNYVSIEGAIPKHDIFILGNYTDLQRVLLNLIENAKDSKKEDIKITLKVDSSIIIDDNEFIKLSVNDNGYGIAEEDIVKIFSDGFTTKGSNEQRGTGLSIVKDIVSNHSGSIEVSSTIEIGTTFNIFFPVRKFNKLSPIYNNKIIVLAEDDSFQREVMSDLLKSMKINVFTASDGIEALDLFYSTKPDLLLIDDKMPRMSGLECIKNIRTENKSAKIVLVTGSSKVKNNSKDSSLRVLNKPYNFDQIKLLLNELL